MSIQEQGKENRSPNHKVKERLLKNKPAIFGLLIIIAAIIIAILGYLITPDQSPNANEQIVEIALKEPGFTCQFLAVKKNRTIEGNNFFERMFFGQINSNKLIPINNYKIREDSIFYETYNGETETGQLQNGENKGLALIDIAYPISMDSAPQHKGDKILFYNLKGKKQGVDLKALQESVQKEHIFNKKFILGTDKYGRCMLSRLILGVRISLMVGLISVFISLTIGIFLGTISGYFGGRIDDFVMLLINTVWSIPTLLLVFAIVLALGKGIGIIFLAVGLTMWVDVARIVRGQVKAVRAIPYVEAAKSMGFSIYRIVGRHVLPNIMGPVFVIAAANFAMAILLEAGLSYLGFGIQPPQPSWGTMLNEHYGLAISGQPLLALVPAMAIMLMVLAFNLVGNGLRDALDVISLD